MEPVCIRQKMGAGALREMRSCRQLRGQKAFACTEEPKRGSWHTLCNGGLLREEARHSLPLLEPPALIGPQVKILTAARGVLMGSWETMHREPGNWASITHTYTACISPQHSMWEARSRLAGHV